MHHQDFPGDPPVTGARKPAYNYRRGSSGTSASSSAGPSSVTAEDTSAQAGSSSPALHHQSQAPGTQVKKKSGFQITSVTPAQISVSGNNSLADDTESYDDMDESHTEDLSSSDILDVSVPRAADTEVPGRSSSDETLNSLHGVDTPGLVSPNEHVHAHMAQGPHTHASMVNGTINPSFYSLPAHHPEGIPASDPTVPSLPIAPLASSSPTISKVGMCQSQRAPVLDNTKHSGGIQTSVNNAHLQSSGTTSVTAVLPLSASAGLDSNLGGEVAVSVSHAHSQPPQAPQTQTTTGSRFRVVKLDTNSEPFRKGRWTCTEYYEKEVPHSAASEAPKGLDMSETEPAPHTLQSYQSNQDFSSPPAMQSPPQGVAQTAPLPYVPVQEGNMGLHLQKPVTAGGAVSQPPNILPHHLQAAYPAQLHTGGVQGTVRQPDFIQPTAPFQTQVQPPLPHMSTGAPITPTAVSGQPPVGISQQLPSQPLLGVTQHSSQPTVNITQQLNAQPPVIITQLPSQPPVGITQQQLPSQPPVSITQLPSQPAVSITQLPSQPAVGITQQQLPSQPAVGITQQLGALSQGAPTPQMPAHPQPPVLPVTMPVQPLPVLGAPPHGAMPLTALQADLQPLLAPIASLSPSTVAGRSSHLEDAHRLLFQHQGLLSLPRLGVPGAGAEGMVDRVSSGAVLGHMGMSVEASALMAAAVGLRGQPADGEDDSSSGASVVAIDNKIEQAMDLVKSHLMYAVREEVEVLKEQIKELIERNSQLEQENTLLKTLASPEQMAQFQAQVQTGGSPTGPGQPAVGSAGTQAALPPSQNMSA